MTIRLRKIKCKYCNTTGYVPKKDYGYCCICNSKINQCANCYLCKSIRKNINACCERCKGVGNIYYDRRTIQQVFIDEVNSFIVINSNMS